MRILEKTVYTAATTLVCWSCLQEFSVHEDCVSDEVRKSFICDECLEKEAIVEHEHNLKEYKGFQHWNAIDEDEMHEIYFSDYPFVATVVFQKRDEGYLTDWWVSGTNLDLKQPRLVLRLGVSLLASDLGELEEEVEAVWDSNLRDLAIDSVMMGGFSASGFNSSFDYTRSVRERIVRYHLMQHDNNWRGEKRSKVLLTAGWHNMTKQFGINQTQQLIAKHEQHLKIFELFDAMRNKTEPSDLKTSHINQRLKLAKDEGLVERKER